MFKETPEAQAKIVAIGQEMALVKVRNTARQWSSREARVQALALSFQNESFRTLEEQPNSELAFGRAEP
jgi:hypothetical protein